MPVVTGIAELPTADLASIFTSPRLRRRRFAMLPLRGPGAVFTAAQPRSPGDATSPEELSDLISSISQIGVLQPVLVEEIAGDGSGAPRLLLVAGERRLRASRWGADHLPDNGHFAELPAIICPGPLSEEERRIWQLVENLAREPLRPGEHAAALLFQRCALLTAKLLRHGHPVSAEAASVLDPVERFAALEKIRGGDAAAAAPWAEVLGRLGLQLSARRAHELVQAFRALPRELSEQMDEAGVRLATRIRFAALRNGRAEAADEIWSQLRTHRRTDLLASASAAAIADRSLNPEQAVACAVEDRRAADAARARRNPSPARPPEEDGIEPADGGAANGHDPRSPATPAPTPTAESAAEDHALPPTPPPAGGDPVAAALGGLRALAEQLHGGLVLSRYDRGSLHLLMVEITRYLEAPANGARS